jgi:hypothetical protein
VLATWDRQALAESTGTSLVLGQATEPATVSGPFSTFWDPADPHHAERSGDPGQPSRH